MFIPEINVDPSEQEYQTIYTDVFAFDSLLPKVLLKEDETLRYQNLQCDFRNNSEKKNSKAQNYVV